MMSPVVEGEGRSSILISSTKPRLMTDNVLKVEPAAITQKVQPRSESTSASDKLKLSQDASKIISGMKKLQVPISANADLTDVAIGKTPIQLKNGMRLSMNVDLMQTEPGIEANKNEEGKVSVEDGNVEEVDPLTSVAEGSEVNVSETFERTCNTDSASATTSDNVAGGAGKDVSDSSDRTFGVATSSSEDGQAKGSEVSATEDSKPPEECSTAAEVVESSVGVESSQPDLDRSEIKNGEIDDLPENEDDCSPLDCDPEDWQILDEVTDVTPKSTPEKRNRRSTSDSDNPKDLTSNSVIESSTVQDSEAEKDELMLDDAEVSKEVVDDNEGEEEAEAAAADDDDDSLSSSKARSQIEKSVVEDDDLSNASMNSVQVSQVCSSSEVENEKMSCGSPVDSPAESPETVDRVDDDEDDGKKEEEEEVEEPKTEAKASDMCLDPCEDDVPAWKHLLVSPTRSPVKSVLTDIPVFENTTNEDGMQMDVNRVVERILNRISPDAEPDESDEKGKEKKLLLEETLKSDPQDSSNLRKALLSPGRIDFGVKRSLSPQLVDLDGGGIEKKLKLEEKTADVAVCVPAPTGLKMKIDLKRKQSNLIEPVEEKPVDILTVKKVKLDSDLPLDENNYSTDPMPTLKACLQGKPKESTPVAPKNLRKASKKELQELIERRLDAYLTKPARTEIGELRAKVASLEKTVEFWRRHSHSLQKKLMEDNIAIQRVAQNMKKPGSVSIVKVSTRSVGLQVQTQVPSFMVGDPSKIGVRGISTAPATSKLFPVSNNSLQPVKQGLVNMNIAVPVSGHQSIVAKQSMSPVRLPPSITPVQIPNSTIVSAAARQAPGSGVSILQPRLTNAQPLQGSIVVNSVTQPSIVSSIIPRVSGVVAPSTATVRTMLDAQRRVGMDGGKEEDGNEEDKEEGRSRASDDHHRMQNLIRPAMRIFRRYLTSCGEKRELSKIPPFRLSQLLTSFLRNVKKKDGSEYGAQALTFVFEGIDQYLQSRRYPALIKKDGRFFSARETLRGRFRQMQAVGTKEKKTALAVVTPPVCGGDLKLGPAWPAAICSFLHWLRTKIGERRALNCVPVMQLDKYIGQYFNVLSDAKRVGNFWSEFVHWLPALRHTGDKPKSNGTRGKELSKQDLKMLTEWLAKPPCNEKCCLTDIPTAILDSYLAQFYVCTNKDEKGEPLSLWRLMRLYHSIEVYLMNVGSGMSVECYQRHFRHSVECYAFKKQLMAKQMKVESELSKEEKVSVGSDSVESACVGIENGKSSEDEGDGCPEFGTEAGGDVPSEKKDLDLICLLEPDISLVEDEEEIVFESGQGDNCEELISEVEQLFHNFTSCALVGENGSVEDLLPPDMDRLLAQFFVTVKRSDGSEYKARDLMQMHKNLQQFLQNHNYKVSIEDDVQFEYSRQCLASKCKALLRQDVSVGRELSPEDKVNLLQRNGVIGKSDPLSLICCLWIHFWRDLHLTTCADHANLKWSDIELKSKNGNEYLEYTGRRLSNSVRCRVEKSDGDACPVEAFKTYTRYRPRSMMKRNDKFYLFLSPTHRSADKPWFSNCALGKEDIEQLEGYLQAAIEKLANDFVSESELSDLKWSLLARLTKGKQKHGLCSRQTFGFSEKQMKIEICGSGNSSAVAGTNAATMLNGLRREAVGNSDECPAVLECSITDQRVREVFVATGHAPNTIVKTMHDVNLLRKWLSSSALSQEVCTFPPVDLNRILLDFFSSLKKRDGTNYEPNSLCSIYFSIDRYLKVHDYTASIKSDAAFQECRAFFHEQRRSADRDASHIIHRRHLDVSFADEDIVALQRERIMGPHSPEAMLLALWYMNTILFGIHSQRAQLHMLWGDFELQITRDGTEYLEYHQHATKAKLISCTPADVLTFNSGNTKKPSKLFAQLDSPGTCPVELFKHFRERRPAGSCNANTRFYLAPGQDGPSSVWFRYSPLGRNKLMSIPTTIRSLIAKVNETPRIKKEEIPLPNANSSCGRAFTSSSKDNPSISLIPLFPCSKTIKQEIDTDAHMSEDVGGGIEDSKRVSRDSCPGVVTRKTAAASMQSNNFVQIIPLTTKES